MIVGLAGSNAAGKTEACKYLESQGFKFFSLSDIIREELQRLELEITRDNLIEMGNKLRSVSGPGVLAMKTREKLGDGDYAIDSIRSPFEAEELRKENGFVLLGVEAPLELRFERLVKRSRFGDPKTLEELKAAEKRENTTDDSNQQLNATFKLSDFVITNTGTMEEFHEKIDKIVEGLR